jgi:predicted LPLAT superfamily acyltransferase
MNPSQFGTDALQGSRTAPSAGWANNGERSNRMMLRIMTLISLHLGRRLSRVVLAGIAAYFVLFAPSARRASREYLRRVLTHEPTLTDDFRHVLSFASTVHDRVFLLNDRFDLFDIRVHGLEHMEAAVEQGRGVFLMGAHFGSFEVMRALARKRGGLGVSLLMYEDNARMINAALKAINPNAAQDIIPLGRLDSMLHLRERLDAGALVGILADRSLHDDDTTYLPFLGRPAPWPRGPLRIAALLHRPVLFMAGMYLGGNRYVVHFMPLADFSACSRGERSAAVDAALESYVAQLEDCCRQAPYNWFNFYDFWQGADAEAAGYSKP